MEGWVVAFVCTKINGDVHETSPFFVRHVRVRYGFMVVEPGQFVKGALAGCLLVMGKTLTGF
nr:MAG TPA: hypothetical protein [Bacteriophage sp.]